jgi:hypothetical protein
LSVHHLASGDQAVAGREHREASSAPSALRFLLLELAQLVRMHEAMLQVVARWANPAIIVTFGEARRSTAWRSWWARRGRRRS